MTLYFFFVRRVIDSRYSKRWLWIYRRYTGLLTAAKHAQRRNWRQSLGWIRWTLS